MPESPVREEDEVHPHVHRGPNVHREDVPIARFRVSPVDPVEGVQRAIGDTQVDVQPCSSCCVRASHWDIHLSSQRSRVSAKRAQGLGW